MEDKKESRKNLITMVIAIAINLVIVGVIAFLEFGTDVRSAPAVFLEDIRLGWLLVALLCFGLALYMDFLKYRKMLMASEGTDDPRGALEVAILGKYYDNITPLGAGGQPFQMYYLKKRGFSPGTAGALPVTGFLTQQFAYVFVALVVFILNPGAASASPVIDRKSVV